jgi:hypothetical protein
MRSFRDTLYIMQTIFFCFFKYTSVNLFSLFYWLFNFYSEQNGFMYFGWFVCLTAFRSQTKVLVEK